MRDMVQSILDAVSKWGPWVLVLLMIIPLVGIWQLWRQRESLTRKALTWGLVKRVWWVVTLGIGLWLLKIQLAPLTGSLTTLQGARDEKVPDLSFRDLVDDSPHHLREFEGKVVLLNLWATYCPPCIEELPTLARLQAAYRDRGLVVVALSDESREHLQDFLKLHEVDLLSGYTPSFEWLKIENFRPFTLIIDRQGVLRKHHFGISDYERFESLIKPYL